MLEKSTSCAVTKKFFYKHLKQIKKLKMNFDFTLGTMYLTKTILFLIAIFLIKNTFCKNAVIIVNDDKIQTVVDRHVKRTL